MAPLVPYNWVAESVGGKYTLTGNQLPHIGTWDCQTCVGVYFAFQDQSCFCAHINPVIDIHQGLWERIPKPDEGEKLEKLIFALLKEHCGSASALNPDREIIVVCPRLYENKWAKDPAKWAKLVGYYVVEGIRAWLAESTASTKSVVCDESAQGFVVNNKTGEVVKFLTSSSWDELTEGVVTGGWFMKPEEKSLPGQHWQPSVQREVGRRVRSV